VCGVGRKIGYVSKIDPSTGQTTFSRKWAPSLRRKARLKAAAAAAAGPCHCAVGHAVHVFRWYLIDLKLVNPAPGKKRRCLYEAELESVRAALQAERSLCAQLEVQLVQQQQAKMAQLKRSWSES
jgi:hypothetical protein